MQAVNGVLKICGYFNKEPFPNYEIYARNVIEFTKSFEPGTAAAAWNPMGSLKVVVRTIGDSISPEIKRQLDDGIADMIINTTVQMRKFRQPDGGFSYGKRGSSTYSNDVKVSLGLPEGDVNAIYVQDRRPITHGRSKYELIPHARLNAHRPDSSISCLW
jgi:hypothetical protein